MGLDLSSIETSTETSLVAQMVKRLPAMREIPVQSLGREDLGSIHGLGRSPGVGNGNPLQYSCLESPMDRGAWWATVHGVTNHQTQLSDFTFSSISFFFFFLFIGCRVGSSLAVVSRGYALLAGCGPEWWPLLWGQAPRHRASVAVAPWPGAQPR